MLNKLKRTFPAASLLLACIATLAHATTFRAQPTDYESKIAALKPGDTLQLGAGAYRAGLMLHDVAGLPGAPIVIQGQKGTVFHARGTGATISVANASYVVIRKLELQGDGLHVDAVKAERGAFAHDITLEGLVIRGHGATQQTVGISTKCPVWRWRISDNVIVGAGTGMYLGDSDGTAPFVAGIIENNLIIDTIGYNIEIKHQQPRPAVADLPEEPSTTVIRHNVFAKTRDVVSVDGPRPNVLVGHFPLHGAGVEDRYAIYGNFFYQNSNEALFQGEGNVALYANVFVNTVGDAIHIQPHHDVPRRVVVAFNTVLAKGAGISVVRKAGVVPLQESVFDNVVFAGRPILGSDQQHNLIGAYTDATTYLRRPFAAPGALDVYPRRPLTGQGVDTSEEMLPDWKLDFDARQRVANRIGAYTSLARAPAWQLRLSRKMARAPR